MCTLNSLFTCAHSSRRVRMHIYIHVWWCACTWTCARAWVCGHTWMYTCICVCYLRVHVYTYVFITYSHSHSHTHLLSYSHTHLHSHSHSHLRLFLSSVLSWRLFFMLSSCSASLSSRGWPLFSPLLLSHSHSRLASMSELRSRLLYFLCCPHSARPRLASQGDPRMGARLTYASFSHHFFTSFSPYLHLIFTSFSHHFRFCSLIFEHVLPTRSVSSFLPFTVWVIRDWGRLL
jgi:hypothetical protein